LADKLLPSEHRIETKVTHEFKDGMYIRTMYMPKDTITVGKIHLVSGANFVTKGDITVLTEHGVQRLQKGFIGVSRAGIQKVGWAHEDTVFVNVFVTDLTNIEDFEAGYTTVDRAHPQLLALFAPLKEIA